MTSPWRYTPQFKVEYRGFTFQYDTAQEFGTMVAESRCGMANPYEPDTTEFEDFMEAVYLVRDRRNK